MASTRLEMCVEGRQELQGVLWVKTNQLLSMLVRYSVLLHQSVAMWFGNRVVHRFPAAGLGGVDLLGELVMQSDPTPLDVSH